MKKIRKRHLLIDMEQRQLVLNSVIIDEYPKLKRVLGKYKNIVKKDLEDDDNFDSELRNIIENVFKKIMEVAVEEWYGANEFVVIDPINKKDRTKCSLCGTPNIYIYHITNRHNNIKLNVGSECINKFPGIDNKLLKGMTINQAKSKAIKDAKRLRRLEVFNSRFPNSSTLLLDWKKEYINLPIILPIDLHNSLTTLHEDTDHIFQSYENGQGTNEDLDKFEELINLRRELINRANEFINLNKDQKFICSKEIYNWLRELGSEGDKIIEIIRNNESMLTKESITSIYESKFLDKVIADFKVMLLHTNVTIERVLDGDIYFKFKDRKRRLECSLYLSVKDFMQRYGCKLLLEDQTITEYNLLDDAKFSFNEKNYTIIIDELKDILYGTKYKVTLDYEDMRHGLEFVNSQDNIFKNKISPTIFLNNHRKDILFKNVDTQKNICKNISSIRAWKPLSDKEKYKVGNISKKPEDYRTELKEESSNG